MNLVRRIIADRMVESKRISPHVTTVIEVDVTKLVRWRDKHKDDFKRQEGINLTYMPAFVEAVSKALIEIPAGKCFGGRIQCNFEKNINVGIAVSLNDGNLIVPVIHNSDRLSLSGLAHSIDSRWQKAGPINCRQTIFREVLLRSPTLVRSRTSSVRLSSTSPVAILL